MNFKRMVALIGLGVVSHVAYGADEGFYFGLNAGQAKYDFVQAPSRRFIPTGTTRISLNPYITPFPNIPVAGGVATVGGVAFAPLNAFWLPGEDDEDTAFSGLVGYRIFPYAAVELSYVHLGTLSEHQPELRIGQTLLIPAVNSELETEGPALSGLAIIPVLKNWDIYLRGGILFADQKVTHSASVGFSEPNTYGSDAWLFGVGTQYDFGAHWTVRLDFQRYDSVGEENGIGEADIDVLSLGVLFRL